MNRHFTALTLLFGLALSGCSKNPAQKEALSLAKGKRLFQQKDYRRAVLEFQNAMQAMPQDAEPYFQLGLTYLELNDLSAAGRALQSAAEIDPTHPGAQLKLVELMAARSDRGAIEIAVKRLGIALNERPEDTEVLHTLAIAEARLGNLEDAVEHLQRALSKAPADLRSSVSLARIKIAQGNLSGAEEVMRAAVRQAPQSADAALASAEFYLRTKRDDRGNAEVYRALQLDPTNESALVVLAAMQSRQGQVDQAEQTYKRLAQVAGTRYKHLFAIFLFQEGKRDEAVAELERLGRADPNDKDMRSRLVAAYLETHRTGEAEDLLEAALKHNSTDAQALIQRSEMYLRIGKYAEAERDARRLVDSQPESANAHYALSRVLLAQGSPEAQRRELNEALRLDPNLLPARTELSQAWIASGNTGTAVEVMNQTPEAQKNTLPGIIGQNGALLAHGDEPAARRGIDQGLALERLPALLYQDAVLKTMQKDYPAARSSLDELLKVKPEDLRAWALLGNAYAAQNQLPAAVQKLRQIAAQRSKSAILQYLLAQWLIAVGNRSEARAALTAAKSADPTMIDADLTFAKLEFSDGKPDAARKLLTGVVANHPNNTSVRLMLADVEEKTGNPSAAVAQYRAIVEANPKQLLALNNLAYRLLQDNPDEALIYAQQADQMAPDNPAVQDTMGWAYYRKGLYGPAVQHLETSVSREGTPLRKFHLAMAYLKIGDENRAREILKSALKADPSLAKASDR